MKLIIAGSRSILDYHVLLKAMEKCPWKISEIVSGTAQGADKLGERWAYENNLPLRRFRPNWYKYGSAAGFKRNVEMAEYADALVALWNGVSRGTSHMIDIARKNEMPIIIERTDL